MRERSSAWQCARRALTLALPALVAVVCASPMLAGPPGFLWRIADISASVVRDDEVLGIGQYLLLEQALRPGESGWMEMKLDLPEHWQVTKVAMEGEAVLVHVEREPRPFALTRENVAMLGARLLDGTWRMADVQLESAWRAAAAADAAPTVRPEP
jgi:hypothetical protein